MGKLAFSYDIFVAQQAGGVTRCMLEMMRALPGDWQSWTPLTQNRMLREVASEPWFEQRWHRGLVRHGGRIRASLQTEPSFAKWLRKAQVAIVHRTYYPIIDLAPKRCKRVITVHDMWDERSEFREDRGSRVRSLIKRRACRTADQIICVSDYTRQELLTLWPWAADKVAVVPHGVRRLGEAVPAGIDSPFILFVGRRGLYKNFAVAITALAEADLGQHKLVCFGGGALTASERTLVNGLGLTSRVVQLDGDDAQLAGLYEAADALVYPSAYEGFGLPLLEAMIHGCPVIASTLTSLPEVGGDAAIYADPADGQSWTEALRAVALDGELSEKLRASGRLRAADFSWSRSAADHKRIYDRLA